MPCQELAAAAGVQAGSAAWQSRRKKASERLSRPIRDAPGAERRPAAGGIEAEVGPQRQCRHQLCQANFNRPRGHHDARFQSDRHTATADAIQVTRTPPRVKNHFCVTS